MIRAVILALLLLLPLRPAHAEEPSLADRAFDLFEQDKDKRGAALDFFTARAKPDAAAALILALRFVEADYERVIEVLQTVTGEKGKLGWTDWMLWQEAHPEIAVMPGYADLFRRVHALIDPNFQIFFPEGVAHEIRMEEIAWGGVTKDGIPALTRPALVAADKAGYLNDDDLVFGIAINGDARAYPLRILDWHEMLNDVIGGVPVSLAYCTLCGSGILFETQTEFFKSFPLVFGSSGFLYRSNKLMYDTATHSLWNQFTGRPVVGPLTGSGVVLKTRPVVITRWADWRARHPGTRVVAEDTGFKRDYSPGAAYSEYFSSPDLMFPTRVDEGKLKQKDYVFALRSSGVEKAWPLDLFKGGAVINDKAGAVDLVLVGDAATRTVRAYRSEGLTFAKGPTADELAAEGKAWRVTEDALVGPDGRTLPRLPGHIAYWFAWSGYFGREGEVGGK